MVYANAVTTVSPTYASEVLNGGQAGWLRSTLLRPEIKSKVCALPLGACALPLLFCLLFRVWLSAQRWQERGEAGGACVASRWLRSTVLLA
jgi:hypothetical protein